MFPVGEYRKSEIRALAKKYVLPNANRPDSQGLCFVGDVGVDEFLQRFLPTQEGKVLDMQGRVIGRHRGAILYTIGQRHGFEVSAPNVPHYIVGLRVEKNEVTVSERKEDAARKKVPLKEMEWIVPRELPLNCLAQVRYREIARPCTLRREGGFVIAEFEEPRIASRGQSVVVYEGDMCLGGGIID
jgi:tRNA-specific 2-thiouridylase